MGPTTLLPLRRKACWGFLRPKNPTASAGFEPANLGTKGQHATPRPPKPILNNTAFFLSVSSSSAFIISNSITTNARNARPINPDRLISCSHFFSLLSSKNSYTQPVDFNVHQTLSHWRIVILPIRGEMNGLKANRNNWMMYFSHRFHHTLKKQLLCTKLVVGQHSETWRKMGMTYLACSDRLNKSNPTTFSEYNQEDVTFLNLFISVGRSTCFRRFSVHHQELKTAQTASGHYCYLLLAWPG